MGLDYSYMLYFKRDSIWEVLKSIKDIAWEHDPPTRIHFPDHVLPIPFDITSVKGKEFQYDDPELDFDTVLEVDWDEAIIDYLHDSNTEDSHRSPPGHGQQKKASIGMIYLHVYQEDPYQPMPDLVLFRFTAATTLMSILFDHSASIRCTFTGLLEKFNGVCGVLDRESGGGRLFWFHGKSYTIDIKDAYLTPDEIEDLLRTLNQRDENG